MIYKIGRFFGVFLSVFSVLKKEKFGIAISGFEGFCILYGDRILQPDNLQSSLSPSLSRTLVVAASKTSNEILLPPPPPQFQGTEELVPLSKALGTPQTCVYPHMCLGINIVSGKAALLGQGVW